MHIIAIIRIQDHRPPPLGQMGDLSSEAVSVATFLLLNFGRALSCGRCTGVGISPSNISCHTFTPPCHTAASLEWAAGRNSGLVPQPLELPHIWFETNTFRNLKQIDFTIWDKYISNTGSSLEKLWPCPKATQAAAQFCLKAFNTGIFNQSAQILKKHLINRQYGKISFTGDGSKLSYCQNQSSLCNS